MAVTSSPRAPRSRRGWPSSACRCGLARARPRPSWRERRFAYLPLAALCPALDRLLTLRGLLGLRSPINTAVRLLNPFDAPCSVAGVFHPPYIDVHLGAAQLLGRGRLAVVKGGGGEAERNPAKPVAVHLWSADAGRCELLLPAAPPAGRARHR